MRRLRLAALLLAGAVLLAGCTLVPTTSSPNRIARNQIPFGLLGRSIPGTNGGRVRFRSQPVYLVDATGHLAPSSRIIPSPPALATVLRQLILGPSYIETSAGFSSALPTSLEVLSASIRDNIGYVDLATSLSALPRTQRILAVGQLALTAADVGATKGIEITVAGVTSLSLLPNGRRSLIVATSDYANLLNG